MRLRDILIASAIFLLGVGATADVVTYQLTGNHLLQQATANPATLADSTCTNVPVPARASTLDPQLKILPEYEHACRSAFISDLMIFTNMPISRSNAQDQADKMAARLREFSAQHIQPVVIAEPDSDWGLIDFHEFAGGLYDDWIKTYFAQLASDGITSDMLGLWIPFPEPQQPTWNNNGNPDDFAISVNRYFQSLRMVYPQAKTGILLDSEAGSPSQALQILAYTRLIDNRLIDVAGLQGFPWYPTDDTDSRAPLTSASDFASADLAKQIADSLGTKNIFYNVGTFRHRKATSGGDIAIPTAERSATLDSIVNEAQKSVAQGYHVTVNVFAQNKFDMKEGIDWSYWSPNNYNSSEQTPLFTHFIHELTSKGIQISLFDAR